MKENSDNNDKWLNRNVAGMGLSSYFSDFGHEMVTAVLPAFILSLGGGAATLGLIEGFADAATGFGKVASGWLSDRWHRRKGLMDTGYTVTAGAIAWLIGVTGIPTLFASRVIAWLGRGVRESPRDALLLDVTAPKNYGKVFGFHRSMDTFGAVCGPLVAYYLLHHHASFRMIFAVALIPSILAVVSVLTLVKEKRRPAREQGLTDAIKSLPKSFWWLMLGVGIYGLGDFADSIMVLRATTLLRPGHGLVVAASMAASLYVVHNVFYAVGSLPIGYLGDKFGKLRLLIAGMLLTGLAAIGFAVATSNMIFLTLCFVVAGLGIAAADALEDAVPGDLLSQNNRGTGYGVLAAVNGIGDFASSAIVGLLIAVVSPFAGFLYAACLCGIGAILLKTLPVLPSGNNLKEGA
jgi:MFS family permease